MLKDTPIVHKLLILIPVLLLGACGGGGSDHTNGEDRTPSIPDGSIRGIVFDSRAYNVTVTVFNERGAVLATSRTNGHGDYRASLQSDSQPITISVTAGVYLENASLMPVNLDGDAGLVLRSVDSYQAGDDLHLSVTFFTTLATGLAEYLVHSQGLSTEVAIERAYAEIDAWAAFDTRRTRPVAVFDAANASEILTDEIKAGFVAAGISELTRVVGIDTSTGEHITYTSIGFIAMAYDDIKEDGILDGQGSSGPLTFGNLTITGDTYRTLLATRLLQFVNSTNNKTGLTFNDLVDYASQVNLYAGEMFNYAASPDIRDIYPTVRQFRPAEGAVVSGSFDATALVSDQFGLLSVRYYIDGQFAATAPNPYIPIRSIDTLNYTNGQHAFRINVENFFGNITSVTHTVTINN